MQVWLEPLPATAVERLTITPDIDRSAVELVVHTSGGAGRAAVTVTRAGDTILQSEVGLVVSGIPDCRIL